MKTLYMKKYSFLSICYLVLSLSAIAQKAEVFSTSKGAIKGFDPVAYFTEEKPVMGTEEFTYTWKEATWHFASSENLEKFKKNPEKYSPQYGGYCAYGIAQGYAVKIEPEAWEIVEGKLYLNYNLKVQEDWQLKKQEYIATADSNWPKVLKEK